MKVSALAVFAAGYVVGAKAGRERYEQIRELTQRFADRLEEHANGTLAGASHDGQS